MMEVNPMMMMEVVMDDRKAKDTLPRPLTGHTYQNQYKSF